jgi:hypothetical protein
MIVTDAMVGAALRGFDMTNPESFEGMRKAIARAMTPDPAARMGEALLPCPFCGEAGELVEIESAAPDYPWAFKACCTSCHQHAIGVTRAAAQECAAEAWNRRAPGWIACSPSDEALLAFWRKWSDQLADRTTLADLRADLMALVSPKDPK